MWERQLVIAVITDIYFVKSARVGGPKTGQIGREEKILQLDIQYVRLVALYTGMYICIYRTQYAYSTHTQLHSHPRMPQNNVIHLAL